MFGSFWLIIQFPLLLFCPIFIFARVVYPFLLENFSVIMYVPILILWFLLTWIVPFQGDFLVRFLGTKLGIRYLEIQNFVLLVWSILLFVF